MIPTKMQRKVIYEDLQAVNEERTMWSGGEDRRCRNAAGMTFRLSSQEVLPLPSALPLAAFSPSL